MTTRERLALMDEITRKNNDAWRKYARNPRPGWTWEAPTRQTFQPFDTFGTKCLLAVCTAGMLVLFVLMA